MILYFWSWLLISRYIKPSHRGKTCEPMTVKGRLNSLKTCVVYGIYTTRVRFHTRNLNITLKL